MTVLTLDPLQLIPPPADPDEPHPWTQGQHLLEDLFAVFGSAEDIETGARRSDADRHLLPAWVKSLERAVQRLILLCALRLLAQGLVVAPARKGSHASNRNIDGDVAARMLYPTPRVSSAQPPQDARPGDSGRAPSARDKAGPARHAKADASGAPGLEPEPESDPEPIDLRRRRHLLRRIRAAMAILANPEPFIQRLARRIARQEAAANAPVHVSASTPAVDRSGRRTPYLSFLEALDRAVDQLAELRLRAAPS